MVTEGEETVCEDKRFALFQRLSLESRLSRYQFQLVGMFVEC